MSTQVISKITAREILDSRGNPTIEAEVTTSGGVVLEQVALAEIFVLRASSEELQAHEELLNGLDKAVKGPCIWRTPIS